MENVFEYKSSNGRLVTVIFDQPVATSDFEFVLGVALNEQDLLIGLETLGTYRLF